MNGLKTAVIILLVIASVLIIAATLMMEPKTNAGTMFGQESNVYGTSVHRPKDALLNKVTIICSVVFVLSLIALLAL
ncbi:preprotein translocase subunit SecG [uncultured Murdochiella sp.]|uniref:preprotein translocase subunit SecG n=1 Tax=uncultured Murdochiella sp. TaxID=1586095 RepID=UPI002806220E|nr:preprotein translocase subunit SecG [uncultured Murdochiella sp.]